MAADPPAPLSPADRRSFLEFQARNRRAIWRLGAACALVIGGGGVLAAFGLVAGVGLVLFAVGFVPAVGLFGLGFLVGLTPLTAGLREPLWEASRLVMDSGLLDVFGTLGARPLLLWGLILGLPAGAWLAVRSVWLAAGVGETLLAIGARAPAPGDLEERQLVNVVHEMAVAAGVPPPEVRLLDGGVANAAAVGWAPGEAYVVVGRRLLDGFDREETQGVLAHLVGSIGNGDLRGAAHIHSVLYVMELMIVTVLAPFARRPRRIALRWLAFPLRPGRDAAARAERARELIGLLAGHRALMRPDAGTAAERLGRDYLGRIGSVLVRLCPPFLALLALAQAATGFLLLFASVPVALLWRSRRYLADATAVQLTRNPTGLYRALVRLGQSGALLPGGAAVAHLFVVGPPPGAPAGPAAAARGAIWDREGLLMGWHPSPRRRLRRLLRMGAAPPAPDPPGARARAGAA